MEIKGWSSYKVHHTSTLFYDKSFINSLKKGTPFMCSPERRGLNYQTFNYERPFEPVIHTGNENLLTWQPYVFGALLCTEIILVGHWLLHLVIR